MNTDRQIKDAKIPQIIAIVLNWNGYEDTAKCVLSLRQAAYSNLKIIVVDNGSTDGSAAKLEQTFPDLTLIKLPRNLGYAAGNNAGIRAALEFGTEYILVLNNDVVVDKNFLLPMARLAEKNPALGIVTCKAFLQSHPQRIYCTAGSFSRIRCAGVPLARRYLDRECEVNYISGCVLLVKKKVFETVGLFNEKFFMYCEDLEFARRVVKRFKLAYTPQGIVYHKSGGGDRWKNYTETYLYHTTRNRFWVFQHESYLYRAYVLLFGVLNVLVKAIVIMVNMPTKSHRHNAGKKLLALWSGLMDGVFLSPPTE